MNKIKNNIPLLSTFCVGLLLLFCTCMNVFFDWPYLAWTWIALQLFLLWTCADFITGIIHWWEDTYGNPNWPILGKHVVYPNMIHHQHPTQLLEGSYWNRINTSFIGATIVGTLLWLLGMHAWQMVVCLLFCAQGNEIHAMSHRSDQANGKLILFFQKTGLLQGRKTHRWHHKAPYETNFCVMSEFVNPILNIIGFWTKLEWIILHLFGIEVLRGSRIRDGL